MSFNLSSMGAASEELARTVHGAWTADAITAGMDLTGFDPASPLAERLNWAHNSCLDVAAVYGRSTTRYLQPVAEQVLQCVAFAAGNGMYPPPEFVAIDEGVPGSRRRLVASVACKGSSAEERQTSCWSTGSRRCSDPFLWAAR